MNLRQQLALANAADFMGPGAVGISSPLPCGCKSKETCTHSKGSKKIEADSSATDAEENRWINEGRGSGKKPLFGSPGSDLKPRTLRGY